MQVAELNIGVLWLTAMASLGVYAIVIAGWSSGSNYPLLGGVRSSAQMISYEVGMGLALVAVVMYSGTLNLNEIIASQDRIWNVIPQLPAFLIYFVCAFAETNRPPFDLAEAESELVAGFQTEYSGMRFAMFYLAEYLNAFTVCAIATTLFLGGWRGPAPDFLTPLWPILWFLAKVFALFYLMVWVRGTLPRVRYDRLMSFGWKALIPLGLVWVMLTGAVVVLPEELDLRRGNILTVAAIAAAVVVVLSLVWPTRDRDGHEEVGPR
jgi:NADH-quinone oxidoreductase subunit H